MEILRPVPDRWNCYEPWAEFWNYYMAQGKVEQAHEMAQRVAGMFNDAPKKSTR